MTVVSVELRSIDGKACVSRGRLSGRRAAATGEQRRAQAIAGEQEIGLCRMRLRSGRDG